MKRRILVSVFLVLVILGISGGIGVYLVKTQPKPPRRQPPLQTQKVVAPPIQAATDYDVTLEGFGSARPRVRMQIIAQVAGEVLYRNEDFFSGKFVEENQVLFRIDPEDYRIAADSAKQQVDRLEAQIKRIDQREKNLTASIALEESRVQLAIDELQMAERLQKRGAAGETDILDAKNALLSRRVAVQALENERGLIPAERAELQAQLKSARADLQQAELNLKRTVFKSPVAGRIIKCNLEVGERLQAGQSYGELYGTNWIEVPVSLPAEDLRWLDPKGFRACQFEAAEAPSEDRIRANVIWRGSDRAEPLTWSGCVNRIESGVEAQTRTAVLVVQVRNPPIEKIEARENPLLDINMFCRVEVFGKQLDRVFVLPRSAILPDQEVYVVVDNKLRKRKVNVARVTREKAMILPGNGLREGDRVIISYVPQPVVGMTVDVIERGRLGTESQPVAEAQR